MFRSSDREKCLELFNKYYAGRKFHDALYREVIRKYLAPGERLLDAGCGRYMKFCKELSGTAHVVGIDLDSVLETDNRQEPFGLRGDLDHLPFPNATFDVIISRSVVEHLLAPEQVFQEFWRVLRPGGRVVIITPNKWDYVSVIATLTPHSLHQWLVSKIFRVPEDDIFPTAYRANTAGALRKTLQSANFVERELNSINHYPSYLMFSPILFRLGVLYEKMTSLRAFEALRSSLLCVFEKQASPASRVNETSVRAAEYNRDPLGVR